MNLFPNLRKTLDTEFAFRFFIFRGIMLKKAINGVGNMAKISEKALADLLYKQDGWVEASFLADFFHVSTRTIRNYIAAINKGETEPIILSSYKGYLYNKKTRPKPDEPIGIDEIVTPSERVNFIIRRLIASKDSLDFFVLADELYISDVTLERDLSKARKILKPFGLKISKERDQVVITGTERQKRKYISHLVSTNQRSMLPVARDGFIQGHINHDALKAHIPVLLQQNEIYADDYGLSNIIHHLVITLERISTGQSITEEVPLEKMRNRKEFDVALSIKAFVEKNYGITLCDQELYYIALTISSNSNLFKYKLITPENIHQYIEEKYILLAKMAIRRLEEVFYLEPFDDDFIIRFTIHIHNLMQRWSIGSSINNPLVSKFKSTYPLIYDMAVFVANELRKIENIQVTDDEIAFIAFHIGAYLEENKIAKGRVNALFVYADYHNMHQPVLTKIQQTFEQDMNIVAAVSLNNMNKQYGTCDLIISTVPDVLDTDLPVVNINIFLTQQDFKMIRSKIEEIQLGIKAEGIRKSIQRFAVAKLFKRNFYANNEFDMIRKLTQECIQLGFCDRSFEKEVLDRERMSSTAFPNHVAVPHSMQHNANRSFLSVVLNEEFMQWGGQPVQIIILIGLCKDDLAAFQELFNELIAVLSNPAYTRKLVQCKSYEEFLESLTGFLLEE